MSSSKSLKSRDVEGVRPYSAPAGGWGALHAVARTIRNQMDFGVVNDVQPSKNHG